MGCHVQKEFKSKSHLFNFSSFAYCYWAYMMEAFGWSNIQDFLPFWHISYLAIPLEMEKRSTVVYQPSLLLDSPVWEKQLHVQRLHNSYNKFLESVLLPLYIGVNVGVLSKALLLLFLGGDVFVIHLRWMGGPILFLLCINLYFISSMKSSFLSLKNFFF